MSWRVKARPHPTLHIEFGMALLLFCFAGFYLFGALHENENTRDFITFIAPVPVVFILGIWVGVVRQKTLYSYQITKEGGEVDHRLYFHRYSGTLFKGIALFALFAVLAMIVIMPMIIFALVGIGAVTIPAALKLLAWENEVEHDGFEWERVQLISTDRSRNLVILQRRYDPDIPFEQHYMYFQAFLPPHRIDEFLDVCRRYAPAYTDFQEGRSGF